MKYRKKPVVVEAIQWTDETWDNGELYNFCSGKSEFISGTSIENQLRIFTLEGIMAASKGDYIIRGAHGEFYPCKPGIFKETYEPVS